MMYVRVLGDVGPSLGRGGGNQRGSPFKERRPLRALTERQRSAGGALSVMQRDGRLPAGSGGTVENKTDGVPCSREGGPGRTDVVRGTGVPQKPDPSCFGAIWEGFSEEGTSVLRPEDDLGLARSGAADERLSGCPGQCTAGGRSAEESGLPRSGKPGKSLWVCARELGGTEGFNREHGFLCT